MTMLTVVGPAHDERLYVTSKPKEVYQVHHGFSDQAKLIADGVIEEARLGHIAKVIGLGIVLRQRAEQADRDAARAMELEPELAFDSVL